MTTSSADEDLENIKWLPKMSEIGEQWFQDNFAGFLDGKQNVSKEKNDKFHPNEADILTFFANTGQSQF